MASPHASLLRAAAGPHNYQLALHGLEKRFGLQVAQQVMEYVPRASIVAFRAKLNRFLDSRIWSGLADSRDVLEQLEDFRQNTELELTRVFNDFDLNRDDALDLAEFRQLSKAYVLHKHLFLSSESRQSLENVRVFWQRLGLLQAVEPLIPMIEPIISEQYEEINKEFEQKYLANDSAIVGEAFAQLCSAIPDQILLPEFVAGFALKMHSIKLKFVNARLTPMLQQMMQRIMEKIDTMGPQAYA